MQNVQLNNYYCAAARTNVRAAGRLRYHRARNGNTLRVRLSELHPANTIFTHHILAGGVRSHFFAVCSNLIAKKRMPTRIALTVWVDTAPGAPCTHSPHYYAN